MKESLKAGLQTRFLDARLREHDKITSAFASFPQKRESILIDPTKPNKAIERPS